jgi:hypothetical protein
MVFDILIFINWSFGLDHLSILIGTYLITLPFIPTALWAVWMESRKRSAVEATTKEKEKEE